MSSRISIDNISIKNHKSGFLDPLEWEITFSNSAPLPEPLEWKIIYFGSAENEECDQILEEFEIPPIEAAETMKFEVESPPPDTSKIPRDQLLSVTAMILTVSYRNQQFIRVGYYIHYQYLSEEQTEDLSALSVEEIVKNTKRTVLSDKPRMTKFNIKWEKQLYDDNSKFQSRRELQKEELKLENTEEESSIRSQKGQKMRILQESQQKHGKTQQNQASENINLEFRIECE